MSQERETIERECANALRFLSVDAVEKAQSGHPGMPMGMADIATVLWRQYLSVNPKNPKWFNRDRFVLSNGHGAMLQYALLHLSGFDLTIEDLKAFRQLHSKTPGHPECHDTPGVETTTGPLGQGLATAVGMALAEAHLAAEFNTEKYPIVDHFTYVFAGDGCLMEGISHEACSLAGTLGLGKLIVFYDDNGISIDGEVAPWFSEDVAARFKAYGWHVLEAVDGHDPDAIAKAIEAARSNLAQPSLLCCKTHIGFGSPNKVDTAAAHGSPLGKDEMAATRKALGWTHKPFDIPDAIYEACSLREKGLNTELLWNDLFVQYETEFPEKAADFLRRQYRALPETFAEEADAFVQEMQAKAANSATRKDSNLWLNHFAPKLPELFGGSADLTGSNGTLWKDASILSRDHMIGSYLHYGVREFAMSAMMNGLALHGGLIPFGGTFLVFSDYARNAIRLSALMKQKVIYVLTHDSIGLGEDGPTHQPIEHIAMLRATPDLMVWRPCDAVETAAAWKFALTHVGPSCLLLTRQNLEKQARTEAQCNSIVYGAYVLYESDTPLEALVIATGSEVDIAVNAAKTLAKQGVGVRVVSMPCVEAFRQSPRSYQEAVLPPQISARVAIEAGTTQPWYEFVGLQGCVIGIDRFGLSAPFEQVYEALGITESAVVDAVNRIRSNHLASSIKPVEAEQLSERKS